MSEQRDTLYKRFIQDTNPRYPSGREGWETYLIDRIAELEAVAEAAAAVVPYLDTWLSPDDEEYMNLETLEVCLRTAGYLEEETP